MNTTVMFVADSVPLSGASVRLVGGRDDQEFATDDEGKISIDLDQGTHVFRVEIEEEVWVERTIQREGKAPLFVINVEAQNAQNLLTLNTLQIDLANLVGDRYVFETVLGRGGMGVVVKAVDRMLNRPVAIKMLSDELRENEEAQQIFLVEARSLATLSHPNLVAIHDILNVGGRVLMVFEYVLGENVEKTIRRKGKMSQTEVLRLAIQLTRCVSYLHEHDLIHRDLKPANIITQADGTLKLVDFGLARSLNELYVRGTRVRGTPAYMAPEQIQGIHLTTATDLYQLGITMFEMLSGGLPFKSGDMAYAHVHLDAPRLEEVVPGIDPDLALMVHACLAKRPKDRPANAEILLEQLQQIYARLVNDSNPFATRDRSGAHLPVVPPERFIEPSSGAFGLGALSSHPSIAESSANSEISIVDPSDVSLVQEVVGGSNRGLAVMAAIGLVALLGSAWLLMGEKAPPQASEPSTAVAVSTPVEAAKPAERDEPVSLTDSVAAARGSVVLGVLTAKGEMLEVAQIQPEPEPTPKRPRRIKQRTKRPTDAKPSAKVEQPVVVEKKEEKVKPKAQNGLLSVEQASDKGLLPVSN